MSTPDFAFVTHDAFVADLGALTAALTADDWSPAAIVGIGRGGLVPAVYLSHATGLPMLSCDWSTGIGVDTAIDRIAARTRSGENLLVVDDINDSGGTITAIRAALTDASAALGTVRFAVLIDNIVSAERVDYRARTIDRRVVKDWFVFPWEANAPDGVLAQDAAAVPKRIGLNT